MEGVNAIATARDGAHAAAQSKIELMQQQHTVQMAAKDKLARLHLDYASAHAALISNPGDTTVMEWLREEATGNPQDSVVQDLLGQAESAHAAHQTSPTIPPSLSRLCR